VDAQHRSSGSTGLVKVRFALEPDDGWPPVGSEGMWAQPLGNGRFRIDNTPWFVRDLASGDVVEATFDSDGVLWAGARIEFSGRLTVRVIPFRAGPLGGDLQAVLDAFAELGVSGEGALPAYAIVALDIPPDSDHGAIIDLLLRGQDDGSWDFEEGCVTDAWIDLRSNR
jgi:hypothetical protein